MRGGGEEEEYKRVRGGRIRGRRSSGGGGRRGGSGGGGRRGGSGGGGRRGDSGGGGGESPDLAPSDFHLFGPLKRHLGGMAFETEDNLISELRNWFDNLDVDFFRIVLSKTLTFHYLPPAISSRIQTSYDITVNVAPQLLPTAPPRSFLPFSQHPFAGSFCGLLGYLEALSIHCRM
ncbi:hypothetical protein PoB_005752300 [Plakobranchus ocellatus]|uniref:Uncharacterized protein n=1 Tax=Plakobranchus ocellatus TaxID=259542 RepID=A0AAV4CIX2_9GAST|nr:hypothetical protein PoB_005752300 [Plakobranchus ocellatus]